jgi:mannose-6-phosphate isomerase-like protein (cupin superfamily)
MRGFPQDDMQIRFSTRVTFGTLRFKRNKTCRADLLENTQTGLVVYDSAMQIIEGAGVWTGLAATATDWAEHLRTPDLSVGTYCIPAGGLDSQSPHTEDEIYVVTAGRAKIVTPDGAADVEPGSVIFVPAGEEHRFHEVTEDLALLVVFGPAYGSRG